MATIKNEQGNYVIDPLTRIEGHLRVEVEVTDGKVSDAWVSGGLYRGMETILKGRQPTDAFYISQRICGVCPISHGHASSMGSEAALGIKVPNGGRIVRNIIECAEYLHSHILWFYTLAALDYVDPAKAITANVADTYALAAQAGTGTADFGAVKDRIAALVDSGQLSIFTNGWFGHPAYPTDMPAELHLIGVAHYLQALEMQAEAARVIALMGGKFPHFMTSIPGGTAWVPTEDKLDDVLYRLKTVEGFVKGTVVPDTLALAPFYLDALTYGGSQGNFISWGVFEDESMNPEDRWMPPGFLTLTDGKVQPATGDMTKEYSKHAWNDADPNLTQWDGETKPNFQSYDIKDKYTWVKAARYNDLPAEAGPLSRMLIGYLNPDKKYDPIRELVDTGLKALGAEGHPEVLNSLLGRIAARNLEGVHTVDLAISQVMELIEAVKGGNADLFAPAEKKDGEGGGLWEAPRGALAHWVKIKGGKIENYNIITPSTWNLCGRDDKDDAGRGPLEHALIGTPIIDPERPIEAARIARSFDP